jgi:hypothetical protein
LPGPQGVIGLPGSDGSQGPAGYQGSTGAAGQSGQEGPQGDLGPQGNQGSKAAIVRVLDGYRELDCIESPEVLFLDVLRVKHAGIETSWLVDSLFVEACEIGTVFVLSVTASEPVEVGAKMESQMSFKLTTREECEVDCSIILCGVRKGFAGRRFVKRTEQEFRRNQEFWSNI